MDILINFFSDEEIEYMVNHDNRRLLTIFATIDHMLHIAVPQNLEDVKITLDKESFSKLKCIKTKKTDESCTICIENYKKYQNLVVLDCEHYFHKRCIKGWLTKESSKCPICRADTRTLDNTTK